MERLSLSNAAFEGNNNAYLFHGGEETALVDTGDGMATTREQLTEHLNEHGVTFADIDHIFLTHWHGDHVGLAGEIQTESNAEVYVHAADAPLVESDEDAWADMQATQERYFDHWRMPMEKQEILRDRLAGPDETAEKLTVTTFEGGETFAFDGVELEVVHVSGHAAGLSMFEFETENGREIFSGDALLPVYTPNVGGADVRVDNPLEKYLQGLQRIVDSNYDRAWPGHRESIEEPADRAADIIHHHEERAWRVLDTLRRKGACDTWTVSAELFGELDDIHILHGPGESYAHLEHLERDGTVIHDGTKYRLAKGIAEELDQLEEQRWELSF